MVHLNSTTWRRKSEDAKKAHERRWRRYCRTLTPTEYLEMNRMMRAWVDVAAAAAKITLPVGIEEIDDVVTLLKAKDAFEADWLQRHERK